MNNAFKFNINRIAFDENYHPSEGTRLTTNFANLARGERRKENLSNALAMINNRFNALADWDNPEGNRFSVELEIISVDMEIDHPESGDKFPAIEILKTNIVDHKTNKRIEGLAGNNFSSYVRDYDFSILLQDHNKGRSEFSVPDNFGSLHGQLFQNFIRSGAYKAQFEKPPVICLSVSDSKTYHRTDNQHPVLGF